MSESDTRQWQAAALEVKRLTVQFRQLARVGHVQPVRDVSLSLRYGETICLIGQSACGKSTLLKTMAGLVRPTHGSLALNGRPYRLDEFGRMRNLRRQLQMVPQDVLGSFDPLRTIGFGITSPLRWLSPQLTESERLERVLNVCTLCGLDHVLLNRMPSQISGGQAKRAGLARALVVEPTVVLLDEPFGAIDYPQQREMIQTLRHVFRSGRLAVLCVTHELWHVRALADSVAVMEDGHLIEIGPIEEVLRNPRTNVMREFLARDAQLTSALSPQSNCAL